MLFFLICIALFIIQGKIEKRIEDKIKEGVLAGYIVQHDGVSVNLFSGSASINSLVVLPDPGFVGEPFSKSLRIDSLSVSALKIGHVGLVRYLVNKKVSIGKIALIEPKIFIRIAENQPKTEPKSKIFDQVRKIFLRTFLVEHLAMEVRQLSTGKLLYALEDLSLTARALKFRQKMGSLSSSIQL